MPYLNYDIMVHGTGARWNKHKGADSAAHPLFGRWHLLRWQRALHVKRLRILLLLSSLRPASSRFTAGAWPCAYGRIPMLEHFHGVIMLLQ
jgi:hypothetical protein